LKGYALKIVGSFGKSSAMNYLIEAVGKDKTFYFRSKELPSFGFQFSVLNNCMIYAFSMDKSLTVPISCNANTSAVVLAVNEKSD